MGFQINYAGTIRQIEDLVQILFEKLSRNCKYCELQKTAGLAGPDYNTCLYYGRKGSQRCDREICPVLEEE